MPNQAPLSFFESASYARERKCMSCLVISTEAELVAVPSSSLLTLVKAPICVQVSLLNCFRTRQVHMSHHLGWSLPIVSKKSPFKADIALIGASAKTLNSRIHRFLINFGEIFEEFIPYMKEILSF